MTRSGAGKIISVGGTSFSGSTFFHMILAHDPEGFAVGELEFLFNPTAPHHVNRPCSCGDSDCGIWEQVKRAGASRAYEKLFELEPRARFIVDSSKDSFWISRQQEHLAESGVQTKNILIWKTPQELYSSMTRRGRGKQSTSVWINYHLMYFTLIPDWRAVPYARLVQEPDTLRSACEWLEIPYFKGKEEFWNKVHHIFGGNRTARFHLYSGERAEEQLQNTFDEDRMRFHRRIYNSNEDANLMQLRDAVGPQQEERVGTILDALHARYVSVDQSPDSDLPIMPKVAVSARQMKNRAKNAYGRWRYGSRRPAV